MSSFFSYSCVVNQWRLVTNTLRVLEGNEAECFSIHLIDGKGVFNGAGLDRSIRQVQMRELGISYVVVAIMGPQSSKEYTCELSFRTNVRIIKNQTTIGIWMARCTGIEPYTIIMDLEGNDGRERGENDTAFEKQIALFALAVSDIVLINMWCSDIDREQASNKPLLRIVFHVHLCVQIKVEALAHYEHLQEEFKKEVAVLRKKFSKSIEKMTTSSTNNSVFRGFFEKQKLTGPNFIYWYRQLRIVISIKDKLNYLDQHNPPAPIAPAGQQVAPEILAAHNAWEEGPLVSSYVLKMKGYIDNLERLGYPVTLGLGNHRKGKNKQAYAPKPKIPRYLAELMKKKKNTLLELVVQGLRDSRKLKPRAISLYVGNGQREAKAISAFYLCLPSGLEIVLNNCHYAPSITRGVISVSYLYDDGFVNCFVDNTIQVSRNNVVYFCAIPRDGIFEIDSSVYDVSNKKAKLDLDSALLWHCQLGHISKKRIEKLQHDGLLNSSDLRAFKICVSCMFRKMERKPYTHQVERDKALLGLIHTDEVKNQLGKTIKSLRSDRGGEYMSQEFLDHLKDHRIIAYRTLPYTPQHNGVSERRNRTLLDMVRSIISQTTLPKSFWDYALKTVARILNMVPTKKRDTLTKPDKLEPISFKSIFVGYQKETMGYSFYYPPENKVLVARNTKFLENSLIDQEASGSLEDLEIIQEEDTHPSLDTSLNHEEDDLKIDEPQSDIIPILRSTRTRYAPDRMCLYIDDEEHELGDLGEPANYKAALLDPESKKWLNAMNVEMQSMKDNEVWVLVELPPNGKTIGSKWLFKKKTDIDGNVHVYKARLVAKGYTQTPRIDYEETFSPVADIRAIRILIAIAVYHDYEIWQMDVKTAFLNEYLNEKEKLNLSKSQGASTPAEMKRMQNVSYASAVGFIMYVVRCTRPDVAFAQNEAVWVRRFISGLSVVPIIEEPISMYCDNTEGIAIANESGITKGAKHFCAKVHYLQEVIEFGDIKLEKVHTDDNLADPFTKTLAFPKHSKHTRNIGMLPASSLM
uniref:Integrase catalytic domain-containing protein n=1 Tax=Tanacetum cinerariifolium TaxID=118510 RepID=A0A6L2KSL2_TANCI|nr:hypothetical protein [Tanacetum cinerariifolium]